MAAAWLMAIASVFIAISGCFNLLAIIRLKRMIDRVFVEGIRRQDSTSETL